MGFVLSVARGLLLALFVAVPVCAQSWTLPDTTNGDSITLGFGAEVGIGRFENADGTSERYVASVLTPGFAFGRWEGALRLRLKWKLTGLRDERYRSLSDYLALIRYVQYAQKGDSGAYVRIGDLEEERLGYGQFVNEYSNTVSLDDPRLGSAIDYRSDRLTVEGLLSDLARPEVFGFRSAYRPLLGDSTARYEDISIGVTVAGDLSDVGAYVNRSEPGLPFLFEPDPTGQSPGIGSGFNDGHLLMASVDVGLPILRSERDQVTAFAEVAKMFGFGSGLSLGLTASRTVGSGILESTLEQRLIGRQYLPAYFNALYEVERMREIEIERDGENLTVVNTKRNQLMARDRVELGSFVELGARFGRRYRIRASFEHAWNHAESGWFHIDFVARDRSLPLQFRLSFDRIHVSNVSDILNGPGRDALLRLEFVYQVRTHLLLGFRFRQSFEPVERLGRRVGQTKRTRIEPGLVLRL